MDVGWKTLGRPPRILVTGATGFIGSFLVEAMLREGCQVYCLSRSGSRDRTTNESRVIEAIRTVNPRANVSRISVLEGDVTQPLAGLDRSTINGLHKMIDEIWHCAADTSFNKNQRKRILSTNYDGTINMIDLAEEIECPSFCFISTAYVCNAHPALATEDPVTRQIYHNAYEYSKRLAESRLIKRAANAGFVGTIFRLAVTAGHSKSGLTTQFLSYYNYAKHILGLRRRLIRKLKHDVLADRLADEGVRFIAGKRDMPLSLPLSPEGCMVLPIRFFCEPESTVNITPVDVVVKTLIRCAYSPRDRLKIVHVTNGNPPKCGPLYQKTLELLGFNGFEIASIRNRQNDPPFEDMKLEISLAGIENSMFSATLPYLPYTINEPKFSRVNLESMIGHENLPDFNVNTEYLRRILNYAVCNKFGKNHKES
ncbi:MAG: NAD-dependent epimerase/dehydratase family protein [Planctomycetes bacterium]|nr:NAD-dependent epimerase/dehydratase family protein [Planctomycetota bacterium]